MTDYLKEEIWKIGKISKNTWLVWAMGRPSLLSAFNISNDCSACMQARWMKLLFHSDGRDVTDFTFITPSVEKMAIKIWSIERQGATAWLVYGENLPELASPQDYNFNFIHTFKFYNLRSRLFNFRWFLCERQAFDIVDLKATTTAEQAQLGKWDVLYIHNCG